MHAPVAQPDERVQDHHDLPWVHLAVPRRHPGPQGLPPRAQKGRVDDGRGCLPDGLSTGERGGVGVRGRHEARKPVRGHGEFGGLVLVGTEQEGSLLLMVYVDRIMVRRACMHS